MKGHTPGPWEWETTRYPKGGWQLFTPKNGHCIVLSFTRLGMQGGQPCFNDRVDQPLGGLMIEAKRLDLNQHPDAKLIAAAPDLLDACKEVEKWIDSLPVSFDYEGLKKLRFAIMKAEVI